MPKASNDINLIKENDPHTKTSKKSPPEPWPLLQFTPFKINNYWDKGEPYLPLSLDQHNPLSIFQLFYTNTIVDQMAEWTNEFAETHPMPEDLTPKGRPKK